MPRRFVTGFQSINSLEESRIWDAVDLEEEAPEEDMYDAFEANYRRESRAPCQRRRPFSGNLAW